MNLLIALALGLLSTTERLSLITSSDQEAVEECVTRFVKGADQQDLEKIDAALHNHFRVMLHSDDSEVQLIDKNAYLTLIKEEKIGGTPRTFSIEQIDVYGAKTAKIKAKLSSGEMNFYSYYSLIKVNGNWKIVQDLVHITTSN
ncbi:nuclear transport factor 2 family protein [Tunicatimonas pelagia]|uniref:nuclear transport factor 2 family protein n=1 Tax=Tunicatimonas pelagia TaxID=931531 RepID=UPI002666F3E1|nr:nuclear transport factor 2 family protein [Tunicatimonas pelagia]WKN44532.1 nuclear transport factor 2 family protein [Tunicatimonas pelagia]